MSTFEDDAGAYDQKDAAGFIQLNALRLKLLAARDRRLRGWILFILPKNTPAGGRISASGEPSAKGKAAP